MKYDVLTRGWIPVVSRDGTTVSLGITDVLLQAHELRAISCESPLETYATLRMLIAFLMDAHKLRGSKDRRALFNEGKFRKEVLDNYITLCKEEGVTFDLFDKNRPFMQAKYDDTLDARKLTPVANLFHALPTGNNHVHFDHAFSAGREFEPGECLRGVLACQLFATAMTGGYPSSVNDTPCYYVLVKGNNLFEMLVLNMLSEGEIGSKCESGKPAWRDDSTLIPMSKYPEIGFLQGLTWETRRITIVEQTDGKIKNMYFQPGRSFHPNGAWVDPHVCFALNKKEELYTLKPKPDRQPWRDVGVFALSAGKGNMPAKVITNRRHLVSEDIPVTVMMFGLATSNAKYEAWVNDSINVPGLVLFDIEKADQLRIDLKFIETVALRVSVAVSQITTSHINPGSNKRADEAKTEYFSKMHTYLFSEYMDKLADAVCENQTWQLDIISIVNERVVREAIEIVQGNLDRTACSSKGLIVQIKAFETFKKEIAKLIKERE